MITPWVQSGYLWNFDRVRKDEFLWVGFDGSFKMQTNAGLNILVWSAMSDSRVGIFEGSSGWTFGSIRDSASL